MKKYFHVTGKGRIIMYLLDAHTHTIASGHGSRDTITDMARAAAKKGVSILAVTDHGPAMPAACGESYFRGIASAPVFRYGVRLLYGAEANILSPDGELDLDDHVLSLLRPVIVSLHRPCYRGPLSRPGNTAAFLRAMEKPSVHILGHLDDTFFQLDYGELILAAKENHVAVELNNASLAPGGYRGDTRGNDLEILSLCRKYHCPVVVSSDSHGVSDIGNFMWAEKLLREAKFPDELVLNSRPDRFLEWIGVKSFHGG